MTGRSMDIGIVVVVTAVYLALAASFPAIGQQTQVVEDWRAIRSETTGVMLDLDPANNVFAVGETISQVVTRKHAPDGPLLWERIAPTPPDRARAGWISTIPRATRSSRPTGDRTALPDRPYPDRKAEDPPRVAGARTAAPARRASGGNLES